MPASSDLVKRELADIWSDPETFASCLLALAFDEFGIDVMSMEPETMRDTVESEYGTRVPAVNTDKLMALITAMTTNLFYTRPDAFTNICNALNGSAVDFRVFDPVEADEAAWAITEVAMNDPMDEDEDRFSPAVRKYVGIILDTEGIHTPPDILASVADMPAVTDARDDMFSGDAMMLEAFSRISAIKAAGVQDYVRQRAAALIDQINKLPLRRRDQKAWQLFYQKAQTGLQSALQPAAVPGR